MRAYVLAMKFYIIQELRNKKWKYRRYGVVELVEAERRLRELERIYAAWPQFQFRIRQAEADHGMFYNTSFCYPVLVGTNHKKEQKFVREHFIAAHLMKIWLLP